MSEIISMMVRFPADSMDDVAVFNRLLDVLEVRNPNTTRSVLSDGQLHWGTLGFRVRLGLSSVKEEKHYVALVVWHASTAPQEYVYGYLKTKLAEAGDDDLLGKAHHRYILFRGGNSSWEPAHEISPVEEMLYRRVLTWENVEMAVKSHGPE